MPKSVIFDDFAGAGADQEDIFRFEVTVNQAATVRGLQARAQRLKDLQDARGRKARLNTKFLAQGDAFKEFHYQESALGRVHAEIVNGDQIGMRKAAGHTALAAEAIESAGIGQELFANHFYSDAAVQRDVGGAIDLAHSALAQTAVASEVTWEGA
jgi:hypothetical protein